MNTRTILYLIIAALIFLAGFLVAKQIIKPNEIIETIIIEGADSIVIDSVPYPVYVDSEPNVKVITLIDTLRIMGVDTITIEKIIDMTKKRFYQDTIFGLIAGDTVLRIETRDSTEGYLTHHEVLWKLYDRKVEVELPAKPTKWAISAHIYTLVGTNTNLVGTIQIRAKNGWHYSVGMSHKKEPVFGVGKTLFQKY